MPETLPSPESIRAALARIAGSEPFRNAPQLLAFLTFVVERTLAGEERAIKGYTIATQALGRSETFDPQTDPIVRVEAGRLRRALDAYYTGEGAEDPLRILIPRGGYVPQFEERTLQARQAEPIAPAAAPHEDEAPDVPVSAVPAAAPAVPAATPAARRRTWLALGALAAALVLALSLGAFWAGRHDAAWLDRALSTPEPRPSVIAEPADGRPVVAVLPAEVVGPPTAALSPDLLRSMVLDGIARFDEVAVIDQPTGQSRGALDRYNLNLRVNTAGPAATVAVRLTHEPSGKIVWARAFDLANRADPGVAAETDVARQIATSVGQPYGVLFADLRQRPSLDTRTRCIVQAYDYWNGPSVEAHARVRDCLEGVMVMQPNAATVLANLAYFYLDEHRVGHNPRPNPLDRALNVARRAVEIAPESPRTNQALMAVLFVRGDVDQALQLGRRALELNPYDTDIMADVGSRFVQMGRYQEGADLIRRAAAANPADPPWYDFFLFLAAYMQNDAEGACVAASRITASDYVLGLVARAIVAAQGGDPVQAREALARLVAIQPEYGRDPAAALARRRFVPDIHRKLLQGLEQAGLRS